MSGFDGVFNFSTRLTPQHLAVISSTDVRRMYHAEHPTRIITAVHVPRPLRGQGHGSRILDAFCELADQYAVDMFVDPRPHDACPLTQLDLMHWYERRDFTIFGGVYRRIARRNKA